MMIWCQKCNRHRKVIAIEDNSVILLCGHVTGITNNTARCRQCDTMVSVIGFNRFEPVLACGHLRTGKDDRLDVLGEEYKSDLTKRAKQDGITLDELNKRDRNSFDRLLNNDFREEFLSLLVKN